MIDGEIKLPSTWKRSNSWNNLLYFYRSPNNWSPLRLAPILSGSRRRLCAKRATGKQSGYGTELPTGWKCSSPVNSIADNQKPNTAHVMVMKPFSPAWLQIVLLLSVST